MKLHDVIGLMQDTATLNEDTAAHLEALLDDYPYFQTAHLLYLANLQKLKDSGFNNELKTAACYVGDRRKLFLQVNREQFLPIEVERLEKPDEPVQMESPFELIDFFLTEKSPKRKDSEENKKKTFPVSPDLISSDYMTYLISKDVMENELETVPMQHQDKIDAFLKQDEIAPVKIQFKETDDELFIVPNLDTVNADDFFSETLAKIYLKQKKYDKALEIIRKLHLLYPEKNIYFADQIRFLELLITNIKKI